MMKKKLRTVIAGGMICLFVSSEPKEAPDIAGDSKENADDQGTWDRIRETGKITALTLYNPASYDIVDNQPGGVNFSLLNELSRDWGVDVEVKTGRNMSELAAMLERGEGDLIAAGVPVSRYMQNTLTFSEELAQVFQVLVQRKDQKQVKKPIDLIGKEVYVIEGSPFHQRLSNLNEEVGGGIIINTASPRTSTNYLIREMLKGNIDYMVTYEHRARAWVKKHPELDAQVKISFPQRIAWATNKSSPKLVNQLNKWLKSKMEDEKVADFMQEYFNKRSLRRTGRKIAGL